MKKAIPLLIVFLISISMAYAANGCAEKTKTGEWCVYTSEDNVAEGAKFTPAACEQTSYCKIGCCYSSDEGRCFRNTPRAACTNALATWNENTQCAIDQCAKGCCVLGDQAFFVTEVKCKQTASMYPEVTMNYNKDVKSEAECVATVKNQDMGCCVKTDSCVFSARASCEVSAEPIAPGDNTTGKKAEQGFYKDMLCSNDLLNCGCAKQKTTSCVGEDVFWFDSCGNMENIYNADKRASYNNGYVLKESESCKATGAGDQNCGNCDYPAGTVCGTDETKSMPVGQYTCVGMGCEKTYEDDVSPNAKGTAKKNGESWCVYDSLPGLGRDLVGSRQYRHLCINGIEMVEPCKDFREEICIQGKLGENALRNLDAMRQMFGDGDYVEAACRDNRYENCWACNTYLSDMEEKSGLTPTIIEKRKNCCIEESFRDCYWLPSTTKGAEKGLDGTCVPQVPPGLKFWGDATQSAQSVQASTDPAAQTGAPSGEATQKCAQASSECVVTYQIKGLERYLGQFGRILKAAFMIGLGEQNGWTVVKNEGCTKKEWVVAGNQICKSVGDCGAYYNIRGRLTMDGYTNSLVDETGFGIDGKARKLRESDVGNYEALTTRTEGEAPGFMDRGGDEWLGVSAATLLVVAFSGKSGGLMEGIITPIMGLIPGGGALSSVMGTFLKPVDSMLSSVLNFGKTTTESLTEAATEAKSAFSTAKDAYDVAHAGVETTHTATVTAQAQVDALSTGGRITAETPELIDAQQKLVSAQAAEAAATAEQTAKHAAMGTAQEASATASEAASKPAEEATGIGSYLQTYMMLRQGLQFIDIMFTQTEDKTYTITCSPWVAPSGGSDCESCNEDMKPCSEYKCKSLGQNCNLVNMGTSNESCIAMDVNDVNSPIIKPLKSVLTPPYTLEEVNEQGNPGYKINEKIKPFTPIVVGVALNEPAVCKYDVIPGTKFDAMPGQFGSSLMLYNQTFGIVLPSELAQKNLTKINKGEYSVYVRCKDGNNNKNEKDYFIRFTIDDSPDLTPPSIRFTSIDNNGFVSASTTQIAFSIFVDEYAECKWSRRDTEYEQMENNFDCQNSMFGQSSVFAGTYECSTALSNLTKTANMFFIKCSDRPGMPNTTRNTMSESYQFKITGSEALNITSIMPSGNLYTKDVTLKVQTVKGADTGKATCGYSNTDVSFANMITFATTGTDKHEQAFTEMEKGDYTYFVSCMDKAGNEARKSTSFSVTVDSVPPMITSVYIDTAFGMLHMEFDEECTCEYSSEVSSFAFGEGTPFGNSNSTIHETQTTGNVYYVKCKDRFDNKGEYRVYKETASSIEDFFF